MERTADQRLSQLRLHKLAGTLFPCVSAPLANQVDVDVIIFLHHMYNKQTSPLSAQSEFRFFFFFSKGADSKPTLPFSSFSLPLRAGRTEGRRRKWCPSALWSPDAIMSLLMSNKSFLPLTAGCVDVQYIVLIVNTSCGFRMIDNWFWLHANLKQSNKKKIM